MASSCATGEPGRLIHSSQSRLDSSRASGEALLPAQTALGWVGGCHRTANSHASWSLVRLLTWLACRAITVSFAFKKDMKGERHGTPNERLLAEQNASRAAATNRPNQLFATGLPLFAWPAFCIPVAAALAIRLLFT